KTAYDLFARLEFRRVLFRSPAGQETLSLDEWMALVDPLERDEFRHRLDEAVGAGRAFVQVLRLRAGGAPRWYRVEARPVVRGEADRKRGVQRRYGVLWCRAC